MTAEKQAKTDKKIQFDINKVIVKDLDGNIIPVHIAKTLGNHLYVTTATLDWLSTAQSIHKEATVDLGENELLYLKGSINSDTCRIIIMCKVALTNYIDELLTSLNCNRE